MGKLHGSLARAGKVCIPVMASDPYSSLGQEANPQGRQGWKDWQSPKGQSLQENHLQQKIQEHW